MVKEKISENLAFLRKKSGLSQAKVAEMCDISLSSYTYYEKGTRAPDAETLAKLADVLEASIDVIVTGDATAPVGDWTLSGKVKRMLSNIITAVEKVLNDHDLEMEAHKKAEMILYLYDVSAKEQHSYDEVEQNASNVIKLMAV